MEDKTSKRFNLILNISIFVILLLIFIHPTTTQVTDKAKELFDPAKGYVVTIFIGAIISIIGFVVSQGYFNYLREKRRKRNINNYLRVVGTEIRTNIRLLCQIHANIYAFIIAGIRLEIQSDHQINNMLIEYSKTDYDFEIIALVKSINANSKYLNNMIDDVETVHLKDITNTNNVELIYQTIDTISYYINEIFDSHNIIANKINSAKEVLLPLCTREMLLVEYKRHQENKTLVNISEGYRNYAKWRPFSSRPNFSRIKA
jgi:hypothetical protein